MLWGDKTNDMSALVSAVSGSAFGAGAQGSSGGQTTAIMVQRGFMDSDATAVASRTLTMGVDPLEDVMPLGMAGSLEGVVTSSAELAERSSKTTAGSSDVGSLEDVGKATRAKVEDERKPHKNMIQSVLENFFVV